MKAWLFFFSDFGVLSMLEVPDVMLIVEGMWVDR